MMFLRSYILSAACLFIFLGALSPALAQGKDQPKDGELFRFGLHGGLLLPPSGLEGRLSSGFAVFSWLETEHSYIPGFLIQYSLGFQSYSSGHTNVSPVSQISLAASVGYEITLSGALPLHLIPSLGFGGAYFSGDDFAGEGLPLAGFFQFQSRLDYTLPWLESALRTGLIFRYQFEFPGVSTIYLGAHVSYNVYF